MGGWFGPPKGPFVLPGGVSKALTEFLTTLDGLRERPGGGFNNPGSRILDFVKAAPSARRLGHRSRVLLLLGVAVAVLEGRGQAQPPTLQIPRVSRPPTLEDFLDDRPREAEAHIMGFRQREPGDGVPASQETSAYLSYDDKNLYVVFVCKDEPAKVRARMARREGIVGDDVVSVVLDTFRDRRRAYLFIVNPLGIQLDAIGTEGQPDDYSFDTVWHSQGRLTPEGFVVWIAIPFRSLRFSNVPTQTWGIALGRVLVRNNETAFWPYITRRLEGFAQQLATLEGLERISPGRNLQFIPYGMFARARFLDVRVPEFVGDRDARAGLDAKMVMRDALTLDVAVNPEFSQVESDEPQVTINQRFEVFFPEKRPFFIENAGYFQTRENLFFSRRIVDPQVGVRLTGKSGGWAFGGLAIDDRAPGRRVGTTDLLYGGRAGIGAVRVQREVAQQSTVGLLVTSRDLASGSNRVISLDSRFKLNPNWIAAGQVMGSRTGQPGGAARWGSAYFAELAHSGRHFNYYARYVDRSPTFASQLGFIPRVDIRQIEQFARYSWRPTRGRVVSFGPFGLALVNWDRRGRVQDWVVNPHFAMEFKGQTQLVINPSRSLELFRDREFRKHSTTVFFSTEWLKWLTISGTYKQGTGVNYFPAPGLGPFLASSTDGRLGVTLRPTPRARFDQTYLYSRLSTREGSTPRGLPIGASIFHNHLLRSKLNYQVTRELSLRMIVDYTAVLPNHTLVALERAKRLTGDILMTYLVNPGTALYVGYTDRYENLAIDDAATGPVLRRIVPPSTSAGRQFFVKLSYLFRY